MSNRLDARPRGMQLVEITPIIVGGDPTDPQNKTWVTRQQHFEMVRYWTRIISDLRKQHRCTGNGGAAILRTCPANQAEQQKTRQALSAKIFRFIGIRPLR